MKQRGKHPSQWVAGLILIAAGIQDIEVRQLVKIAEVSQGRFRRVLTGDRGLTLDEAQALCSVLGMSCSVVAEMTLAETHKRLMAVDMAVEPPPHLVATRPSAA